MARKNPRTALPGVNGQSALENFKADAWKRLLRADAADFVAKAKTAGQRRAAMDRDAAEEERNLALIETEKDRLRKLHAQQEVTSLTKPETLPLTLNKTQAAKRAGVSRETLRGYADEGLIVETDKGRIVTASLANLTKPKKVKCRKVPKNWRLIP